jgi:hypothetical protein
MRQQEQGTDGLRMLTDMPDVLTVSARALIGRLAWTGL